MQMSYYQTFNDYIFANKFGGFNPFCLHLFYRRVQGGDLQRICQHPLNYTNYLMEIAVKPILWTYQ